MANLITAAEVVAMAFGGEQYVRSASISSASIAAAERKHIAPVFNALYDAFQGGSYGEFVDQYIKPPLALYVKLALLPSLYGQTGMEGVVQHSADTYNSAEERVYRRIVQQTTTDADALRALAVAKVELSPEQYPEYDSRVNVLNRVSTAGRIVTLKN